MAAAGELRCVDSAIKSVLEDINSAFVLKEEQRNAIKAFVNQKYVFYSPMEQYQTHILTRIMSMTTSG